MEQEEVKPLPKIEIAYTRPPLHRKVLANIIDGLIFGLLAFLIFLGVRQIANSTPVVKKANEDIIACKLNSGLYEYYDKTQLLSITTIMDNDKKMGGEEKVKKSLEAVDKFVEFGANTTYGGSVELQKTIVMDYDEFRSKLKYNDDTYAFIRDEQGLLIENPVVTEVASQNWYYTNCYKVYFLSHAESFLTSKFSVYYNALIVFRNAIVFVEIPIAYLTSGLLVYLLPPLIFKKGHKTIGKLTYRIGVVNNKCLNLTGKQFAFRFLIFYFAILILSLFTFGIPIIISFSMMAFTKKKQGFQDYMLDFQEVETHNNNIYSSLDEVRLDQINTNKKAIDFKS